MIASLCRGLSFRARGTRQQLRFLSRVKSNEAAPEGIHDDKQSLNFEVGYNQPGALNDALRSFWKHDINMTHIHSRPSAQGGAFVFEVDFEAVPAHKSEALQRDLDKDGAENIQFLGSKSVPWFPRSAVECDTLATNILFAGSDLESDHPGFNDPVYRQRRKTLAEFANNHKFGDAPATIDYSPEEVACWTKIWDRLMPLVKTHACDQWKQTFSELADEAGFRRDNIPQMSDISHFLKSRTGFRLRPVAGLLSSRDFLYGLAFKTFFCTQYLRHPSEPFYTPEPDVVHELIGHAPLFADPNFASFSQQIGLASIGATDEQIDQLARCYWYTVEFGLVKDDEGKTKIYGAGILSSFGEIEYSMGLTDDKPQLLAWDPADAAQRDYPITTFQPTYYVAEDFADAKSKLVGFAEQFNKPFHARWNSHTERIDTDRNIRRQPQEFKAQGEDPTLAKLKNETPQKQE